MRKLGIMFFVLVSMVFIINGCSISKFREVGTEKYYVKIVENGERKDQYYEYKNVPAYNSNGEKILVNITTIEDKELKKDAYLKVIVRSPSTKNTNDIQGFEEVDISKIPEKAKNKLKS